MSHYEERLQQDLNEIRGRVDTIGETVEEAIKKAVKNAVSVIDRAASKGVIHPKSASRRKSTLERRSAQSSTTAS